MEKIETGPDRAFLIAAPRKGTHEIAEVDDHLDELEMLADTAGAVVVGRSIQRVQTPNANSYLGKGKLEELKGVVAELEVDLAVVDEELTPTQGKTLEEELGVRVMDRAELILDIFATRARSAEAKLQVELAQLEYLLPRLARMWVHLSRIRGGIGLRGPGETQIETDRRLIRKRISTLRARLKKVSEHRRRVNRGDDGALTVALVGYTNAGKSSLLRVLTGADAFIENRLFATLDTQTREFAIEGRRIRLIDTVGFIRKLPHHLIASFRSTLEVAVEADLLLHVVDASNPSWREHVQAGENVLRELGAEEKEQVMVFNKVDLLRGLEDLRFNEAVLHDKCVYVSAANKETDELKELLKQRAPLAPWMKYDVGG